MEPKLLIATEVYNPADWGRVVRQLRSGRGWTQTQLGEWLGVSRPTVAKLESGGNVGIEVALRALTLLGAVPTVHPKGTRLVQERQVE